MPASSAPVHRDNFDAGSAGPAGALAVTLARTAWVLQEGAKDAKDALQEKMDSIFPSGSSGNPPVYPNPTDPTRVSSTPVPVRVLQAPAA